MMTLPAHYVAWQREIYGHTQKYGLDCFDVYFELVDYESMNEVASFGGFPVRYPHWRFGMEYERLSKSFAYGLHKIYELVINNDPCYAYLLEGNSATDQKMVMAHVYGHCDFFKNNQWFSPTNRKMIDQMANHGARVRRYVDRYGQDVVEDFLDVCLSIDNLIDRHSPYVKKPRARGLLAEEEEEQVIEPRRLKVSKKYLERYVNPAEVLEQERKELEKEAAELAKRFPQKPEPDVMTFLSEYAPLEKWQQDVINIVRDEAYYFAPQGMTKIMNEGWASYWHSTIMTQDVLTDAEIIDFADNHAATMAVQPGGLNPYKLGIELFRDIEYRWDMGRFGKEYEECDDLDEKLHWDRKLGLGREKIFQVRRIYNDLTFLDEFLTPEFCWRHKIFTYEYNRKRAGFEIFSRDFRSIKDKLMQQLTNFGQPFIFVENANYENRGELLLIHRHDGVDLDMGFGQATLMNIQKIWSRPVHLCTTQDGKERIWTHDGKEFGDAQLGGG
jgi:stage V sporulation protein R